MNIRSGFITNKEEIEIDPKDYIDFINDYINCYIKTSSNELEYKEFSKQYKGLNPRYEFLIHSIKMINVQALNNHNKLYYPRLDGMGIMRLTKSEYSKKDYNWIVNNSLNSTLPLSCKLTDNTNSSYSIILPNGKYIGSDLINNHDIAHMYLLNLLSFNKELYNSYHNDKNYYCYHDYLINKLGIVNKDINKIEYNPKLVTLDQINLIKQYEELGFDIFKYNVSIKDSKELIKTVRFEV